MMEIAAVGKSSVTKEQMELFEVVAAEQPLVALSSDAMTDAAETVTETEVAAGVRVAEVVSASVAADFVVAAVVVAEQVDGVGALVEVVVGVVAEAAINGAGGDYVQVVAVVAVATVGIVVAEPMGQRDSYHLDCYTVALWEGLELAVSQASFATQAVSDWRCRSTVRSVERAEVVDGRLVTHVNAVHGDASEEDADSQAVVVAAAVAVVVVVVEVVGACHGEHCHLFHHYQVAAPLGATVDDAVGTSATVGLAGKEDYSAFAADEEALGTLQLESIPNLLLQRTVASPSVRALVECSPGRKPKPSSAS